MIAAFSITINSEVQAVLGAFLGVLVGTGASAWGARELTLRSMTLEFKGELEDVVERTRPGRLTEQEETALADAQRALLFEVQRFEMRRAWYSRALVGYGALVLMAGASIGLVTGEVPLPPIGVGLAASAALSRGLFGLARQRRISIVGPPLLDLPGPSAAVRGLQFENLAKEYFERQGYVARSAHPALGVDLIVERDGKRLAIEAKARQNMTRRDIDAALGAVARLRHSDLNVDGFVLVVPPQTSPSRAHLLEEDARREGMEVVFLDIASVEDPAAPR